MKGLTSGVLVVLLTGTALWADEPARTRVAERPEAQFRALRESAEAAEKEARKSVGDAKGVQEQEKLFEEYQQRDREFAARAIKLARDNSDKPLAVDVLIWVTTRKIPSLSEQAREILIRDHISSERLVDACRQTAGSVPPDFPSAERLLRVTMEKSPHRRVSGFATFYLAQILVRWSKVIRHVEQHPDRAGRVIGGIESWKQLSKRNADDLEREAEALYSRVIKDYDDIETAQKNMSLGEASQRMLIGLRNLKIGTIAPNIDGKDSEGERFRLSDYRGKVVVLTFSGNWCKPCRAMYPEERKLVERLKDKPFALLSVNTDEDKKSLRESLKTGEISWRCWWESGVEGPICSMWGVSTFPSVYVLDQKGTIRHKFEGPPSPPSRLDEVVDKLLDEAVAPTSR